MYADAWVGRQGHVSRCGNPQPCSIRWRSRRRAVAPSGARAACTAVTTPLTAGAGLLGVCCPRTDAEVIALFRQYENTPETARPAELAVLPYRFNSGLTERERIVVRDQDSWGALWTRIVAPHRPPPAPLAVDFDDEMLV